MVNVKVGTEKQTAGPAPVPMLHNIGTEISNYSPQNYQNFAIIYLP